MGSDTKGGENDDNDDDDDDDSKSDDEYDIFESSMESLFGQHQAASGKPGHKYRLDLGNDVVLNYRIPNHKDNSNTRLMAHFQWDAGVHLALMLNARCRRREDIENIKESKGRLQLQGKSVIELGAGIGLPSLVCALGGAEQVLITDYPDEGIIKTIVENINLCNVNQTAKARGLDWTNAEQVELIFQESPQLEGYDLILCADTLWLSDSHTPLLNTIVRLLKRTASSRVELLSGFHTGRRVLSSFYKKAIQVGLCCDWEEENGSVFEYNTVSQSSRQWSSTLPFPVRGHKECEIDDQSDDNMDDYTERTKWLLHVTLRWADIPA